MLKLKFFIVLILVLSLALTGCGPGSSKQPQPTPVPPPALHSTTNAPSSESTAVTANVQAVVRLFLANDFAAAQKVMLLLPAEQADPKTQRMFADFSLHLNKRLALEAKDAGVKTPVTSISVSNLRAAETGVMLADVSIRAAEELEALTLTVKATQMSGVWLVDFAPFMLALMDALGEE